MKKIFLLAMVLVLVIMVLYFGNAGMWFIGEAPDLEYSSSELKEHTEEICLADLRCKLNQKCFVMMGTSAGTRLNNLRWHIQRKKASIVVEETSYHLGKFGEYRRSGVMGWTFTVYCKIKATAPKGEEFSNESNIDCFIRAKDDGKQLFSIPKCLMNFIKHD